MSASAASAADVAGDSVSEIQVRFVSGTPGDAATPDALAGGMRIAVPANLNKNGLSAVVNHLLGIHADDNSDGPQYDFIVRVEAAPQRRTLLRGSLLSHLHSIAVSTEGVITLEYAPGVKPPQSKPGIDLPDWAAAVAGAESVTIVALFDGTLQVYDVTEGHATAPLQLRAQVAASEGALAGVSACEMAGSSMNVRVASVAKDGLLKLWAVSGTARTMQLLAASAPSSMPSIPTSVSLAPSGAHVYVGDESGHTYTSNWPAAVVDDDGDAVDERAHRKRARHASDVVETVALKRTSTTHTQRIGAVAWLNDDTAVSASWDGAIMLHDVETGGTESTRAAPRGSVHSLAVSSTGGSFASAHGDSCVRLWDARSTDARGTLRHPAPAAWVRSVAWNHAHAQIIATGDSAGRVLMWDVRESSTPVAALHTHAKGDDTSDCFGVAFAGAHGRVCASGGSDAVLRVASVMA